MAVELSVIIPVLNEHDSVKELYNQLTDVLDQIRRSYEIIFVDDGSHDGTVELCRQLVHEDAHIVLVELRRHFGKAVALQAGFQIACGKWIITMDGDLQDDPAEIPRFLQALEAGLDVVSGWKQNRQDRWLKVITSRFFNWTTRLATGIPLQDFNCGFKGYRRAAVERLALYGELHRYIPVLVHAFGFRIGEISVRHRPRQHGRSKYGLERFLRGAIGLLTVLFITRFRDKPLLFFSLPGIGLMSLGLVINLYLAWLWIVGQRPIGNRPLLMLGVLLLIIGAQFFGYGLLAEMLVRVTHRPADVLNFVERVVRHPDNEP